MRPRLSVGFGSTWKTPLADIEWTDCTSFALVDAGITASRGRTAQDIGEFTAGTMDALLHNLLRRLDPGNADGPFAGQLLPGVPIQLEAITDDGTVIDRWSGTVTGWPQRSNEFGTLSTVPIKAYGITEKLARAKFPGTPYDVTLMAHQPKGYWKLNDPSGSQIAVDSSGNGFDGTYRLPSKPTSEGDGLVVGEAAQEFDGVRQAVDLPMAARISHVEDRHIAVVAWFETDEMAASTEYDTIINQGGDGVGLERDTLRLALSDTGVVSWAAYRAGVGATVAGSQTVTDGRRHMISLIVVFTSGTVGALTQVDGEVVATSPLVQPSNVDFSLAIGGAPFPSGTRDFFAGKLSHVALFELGADYLPFAENVEVIFQAGTAPLSGQKADERLDWMLDQVGLPADRRSFAAGQVPLGPATFAAGDRVLDAVRKVEQAEDGRLVELPSGELALLDRYWPYTADEALTVQATFSDDGTGIPYTAPDTLYDDELLINVSTVSRAGGPEITRRNESSIERFGNADDPVPLADLPLLSDNQARSLAEHRVQFRSEVRARIPQLSVPVHKLAPADQALVLSLQEGWRIQVRRTQDGEGDQLVLDQVIEGIVDRVGQGSYWVDFYTSPVPETPGGGGLFRWGISAWGGSDRWGH